MEKTIKASFKDEDRALAQEIGQRSEGTTLNEKIEELFYELPDPLLSAVDVKDSLLGTEDKLAEYKSALGELTGNGVLEVSTSTQRPFDEEDVELYRHKDTHVERLRLIAQEEELDEGHRRIQFTCDGRLIRSLARVDRLDVYAADETGPQRNEFKRHIEDIAESVSDGTHIPSPILLAIDEQNVETLEDGGDEADIPTSRVIIRPLTDYEVVENPIEPTGSPAQKVRTIEIDFPFRRATFDGEKAASVVDGQQRTAALASCSRRCSPDLRRLHRGSRRGSRRSHASLSGSEQHEEDLDRSLEGSKRRTGGGPRLSSAGEEDCPGCQAACTDGR